MTEANKSDIIQILFQVIDEVNPMLSEDRKLNKTEEETLFGDSGKLDSLGLISFVVGVEQKIDAAFGGSISLVNERAMSAENSPLQTVTTLAEYIILLLKERNGG